MPERNYYVLCDDNCRFPAMTKEEIIAAIQAATGHVPSEQEIDQAFITKIKEMNANAELKWWVGTEAQYNAIAEKDVHTLYIITDASEYEDLAEQVEALTTDINSKAPMYQYGTTDLTPGVSDLATGTLYFVYEN